MAWVRAVNVQCSMRMLRTPPEVSLPMPMQAKTRQVSVQLVMRTASVGRPIRAPSMPRPDLRLIESSPVLSAQPSMRTLRHESTSIPSRAPVMFRFRITTSVQYVGCVAQLLPGWRTVKSSQRTSVQLMNSTTSVPRGGRLLAAVAALPSIAPGPTMPTWSTFAAWMSERWPGCQRPSQRISSSG